MYPFSFLPRHSRYSSRYRGPKKKATKILSPEILTWLTAGIFSAAYAALAWGGVPGTRIDRAGVAVAGAAAMLGCGVITTRDAAESIDFDTIALLLGMMVVVAQLHIAGFFELVTNQMAAKCNGPYLLLAVIITISGVLSALLVNDVVCVALTPLVLTLCLKLRRPPIPYLIGLATASNVGSVATITGNPQNIIIGSLSGISYLRFAERLVPIAAIGLILNFLIVAFVYRQSLSSELPEQVSIASRVKPVHRTLLIKTVFITATMIVLFFCGFSIAIVALVAASISLLDRVRPAKIYGHVDWSLLMMFAGLFVIVHAFEIRVVEGLGMQMLISQFESPVPVISGLSLILSNLVSNVPAVLLFKPMMASIPDQEQAWLALAMSSTFAGNLTLLGSVANLIVVETARRAGIEIGFFEYLKAGVVLTLTSILMGVAWLMLTKY